MKVVAFATLFLGLTAGPQSVEVLVGRDVSVVEILVDGLPVARLDGEPWKAICEFGETLEPRNLEAVAYSAEGAEIGRSSQWLNVPRPAAQAEVLLETDPTTGRVSARLRSNSVSSETPEKVTVVFDGQLVPTSDPARIVLPPHDPEQLHYLRVDLQFPDGLTSTVERTFGGSFTDEVAAELTAVPLELGRNSNEPDGSGWLFARGTELSIVDVVTGPADIILVRDQSAQPDLDRMVARFGDFRSVANFKRLYSLYLLRPVAERLERSDTDLRLFRPSPRLTSRDGGMLWLLTSIRAAKAPSHMQRLSDALAVAGMTATSSGHRRAVVLLLGPEAADASQYTPEDVRHYLAKIRVPLVVWSTTGERETPWGSALDTSTMTKLERQTKQLVKSMERQRIAWVRGVYLPPEIILTADDPGIRLAGT